MIGDIADSVCVSGSAPEVEPCINDPGKHPAACAHVARTKGDQEAAFRLRYEVYIAEQGKPYPEADHTQRMLSDELDETAEIIVAESSGHIVGTVRANWFDSASTRLRYLDMFQMVEDKPTRAERVAVCSRLAALPGHRHSRARELLFESIYEVGLARSTELCFATCTPALVRMFKQYGFREYATPIDDLIAGKLCRMLLVLDDLDHLASVRSPFTMIAQRYSLSQQYRPWIGHLFEQ